ncbi:MAG: type IIL restriction-modification enzyme MmeI, partial [Pseudomonadota bacterium]
TQTAELPRTSPRQTSPGPAPPIRTSNEPNQWPDFTPAQTTPCRRSTGPLLHRWLHPQGLQLNLPAEACVRHPHAVAVTEAANNLLAVRENWLNPSDLASSVPDVLPGYPERIVANDAASAAILKERTLTKLYNERPAWLDHAHKDLDAAVAAAYGWPSDLTDDQILECLFALNQERAAKK